MGPEGRAVVRVQRVVHLDHQVCPAQERKALQVHLIEGARELRGDLEKRFQGYQCSGYSLTSIACRLE